MPIFVVASMAVLNHLKLRIVLERGEFRIGLEFIPVLESVFECLANVLQSPIRHAGFGAGLGQDVEIAGALLDGALLNQGALAAVLLEDSGSMATASL